MGQSMLDLRRGERSQSTHRSRLRFAHTRFHVAYPDVLSNNACECRLCISNATVCGHAAMRSTLTSALVVLVLACTMLFRSVEAAALSAQIPRQGKTCFYAWVDQALEKVGFYFAVQEGGDFDTDYVVMSPTDKIILQGEKSSQEDYVFTANEFGEYSFCFENGSSTKEEKLVCIFHYFP